MGTSTMLRLPAGVARKLCRWAQGAWPAEACGLLVGRAAQDAAEVVRATLARNLRAHERGDRYEVDPADHLRAWKAAEAEGLEVLGAWHSHPDQPAVPSATDRAEAFAGLAYLIVEVRAGGAGELRAWRLVEGAFVEQPLER
jgi:proteasome lid subunit RPN8/RPN11